MPGAVTPLHATGFNQDADGTIRTE